MKRLFIISVLSLSVIMLMAGNLWGPLETSEARYAEISREMYQSGDWLHPSLLNIRHYHKPPVTYWITCVAFILFGVHTFAVRFFLVVAWVIQCLLMVKIARLLFEDDETSWLAGCVYSTFPLVLAAARGLTTDMYLLTFVLASVFCWISFLKSSLKAYLYGFAVFLGLAFLTKGPVALLVPVAAILSLRKWKKIPALSAVHLAGATATFAALAFGWFILLIAEDTRFINYFLLRHTVHRIADASVFSRSKPFYYYIMLLPALVLPWLGPAIQALKKIFKKPQQLMLSRLLLYWFLLPLLFFSVASSKLPLYILPLFPALALIISFALKNYRFSATVTISLFVINILVFLTLGLGHIAFVGHLNVVLTSTALILMALAIFIHLSALFREKALIQASLFATGLLVAAAIYLHTEDTSDIDTRKLAIAVHEKDLKERRIFVFDELLPSLAFHLGAVPISVHHGNKNLKRETEFEPNDNWKLYLIDLTTHAGEVQFKTKLQTPSLVVCREEKFQDLKPFLPEKFWVEKFGTRWLIRTHVNENSY